MEISILGAGSWATAMAYVLSKNYNVLLYARKIKDVESINIKHENKKYLDGFLLPENIRATNNIKDLFSNKYIVNAIPTQNTRSVI